MIIHSNDPKIVIANVNDLVNKYMNIPQKMFIDAFTGEDVGEVPVVYNPQNAHQFYDNMTVKTSGDGSTVTLMMNDVVLNIIGMIYNIECDIETGDIRANVSIKYDKIPLYNRQISNCVMEYFDNQLILLFVEVY